MSFNHSEANKYLQDYRWIKSVDELIKDKDKNNIHHGLEQSNWWNSHPLNLLWSDIKLHDSYNCVFINLNIREKIIFLLDMHWKWVCQEFRNKVLWVLNETDPNYYFKKEVIWDENMAKCTLERINVQRKKIMHIVD